MNVLCMGRPFGTPGEPVTYFKSQHGHTIRTLSAEGEADYRFDPRESADDVLARITAIWPVDLFMCWCPEVVPPPRNMESCPVRTAAIVSDWTVYFPQLEHNLLRYDVVVTDSLGAETLKRIPGLNPQYLEPLYSHRTGVHRDLGLARDIDIAFAGNLNHAVHTRRGRLLDRVASLADRYQVVIASALDDASYTELMNRAKFAFNCSLRGEMNLRCFEAIACGAKLLVESDNREIGSRVVPHVPYRDENLADVLESLLEAYDGCRGLAGAGHGKLVRDQAGETRLDDWIERLARAPVSGRAFAALSDAEKALADFMQHPLREPDWETLPPSPELTLARGLSRLEKLEHLDETARRGTLQALLADLQEVATEHPDEVVPWLNLAFVVRRTNAPDAERRLLELALNATGTRFGGLLAGQRRDPFYARWRDAMARGTAAVALLHAAAVYRLAEIADPHEDWATVEEWSVKSATWAPDVAESHRLRAKALSALGRHAEAVQILEASLPLTALDSDHRVALVAAYRAVGQEEAARDLAAKSATIFSAWRGADHAVARFRQ